MRVHFLLVSFSLHLFIFSFLSISLLSNLRRSPFSMARDTKFKINKCQWSISYLMFLWTILIERIGAAFCFWKMKEKVRVTTKKVNILECGNGEALLKIRTEIWCCRTILLWKNNDTDLRRGKNYVS